MATTYNTTGAAAAVFLLFLYFSGLFFSIGYFLAIFLSTMGSIVENLPDASVKEAVDNISPAPAESAAPATQEPRIHPALAARIAARYTPKQETWREDRPVKVRLLSRRLRRRESLMLDLDHRRWCWYWRHIYGRATVTKGA